MDLRAHLAERLGRPQRHRLLQGFPAVPAMVPATPQDPEPSQRRSGLQPLRLLDGAIEDRGFTAAREALAEPFEVPPGLDGPKHRELRERMVASRAAAEKQWQATVARGDRSAPPLFTVDRSRDLIVGIIPHTQCVPRREACGFCTFPHDAAHPAGRAAMLEALTDQLSEHASSPGLEGRKVKAIYIGGGTANLSSPEEIGTIVRVLGASFAIGEAELSLEGAPHLFERLFSSHLKNLAAQPTATKRISMGVQTFDEGFLRLMGRERFGDASLVKKLAKRCRSLSLSASADLLYNLPGQTPAQMDHDLDVALSCGLDQICLYNLVLHEGLGTPWSRDPALVASMRGNREACEQWLRLRERLLAEGYEQTTLTNFERPGAASRFLYEVASFSVEHTDGLGVGPLALSTFVNPGEQRGIKLLRRKDIGPTPWSGGDLMFAYDASTLPLLFITRGLAKTRLSGATYRALFGRALRDDLAEAIAVCQQAGLLAVEGDDVALTPSGMFHADAVVSTLVASRATPAGAGLHTRDLLREEPRAGHYLSMG